MAKLKFDMRRRSFQRDVIAKVEVVAYDKLKHHQFIAGPTTNMAYYLTRHGLNRLLKVLVDPPRRNPSIRQ